MQATLLLPFSLFAIVTGQSLRDSTVSAGRTQLTLQQEVDFPSSPKDVRSTGLVVDHANNNEVWMYHHGFDFAPGIIRKYSHEGELIGSWTPPGQREGSISDAFQAMHLEMVHDGIKLSRRDIHGQSLLLFNGNYNQEPKILTVYALSVDDSDHPTREALQDQRRVFGTLQVRGLDDWVSGGTYHAERKTLFVVTAETDQLIELDPVTGKTLAKHDIKPEWGYSHGAVGDISYDETTGHLFLVSALQNDVVLEVTPEGELVRTIQLPPTLGTSVSSGGIDVDPCGGLWISDSYHPNRVRQWVDDSATSLC